MRPLEWVDVQTGSSHTTDIAYTPNHVRFAHLIHADVGWVSRRPWVLYLASQSYGRGQMKYEYKTKTAAKLDCETMWQEFNQHDESIRIKSDRYVPKLPPAT